ncbi:MAG TPA: hypothetical protein VIS76_15930 [Pseudomonadales bacterium]
MPDPVQPPATGRTARYALYSAQGIVIGTILGSLAAGVVMLYLNYHALGRAGLAKTIGLWGIALFLTVILIASLVPNTPQLAILFTALQAVIAYFLTEKLQGAAIGYHRDHGGPMYSNFRAAMVGFLTGLALFFLLVAGASLFMGVTGQTSGA